MITGDIGNRRALDIRIGSDREHLVALCGDGRADDWGRGFDRSAGTAGFEAVCSATGQKGGWQPAPSSGAGYFGCRGRGART